jgi:hypothetical protein
MIVGAAQKTQNGASSNLFTAVELPKHTARPRPPHTKDEARPIATNNVKLPDFIEEPTT